MYFFYYVPVGCDAGRTRFPLMTVFFSAVCILAFALLKYFPGATGLDLYNFIYYPGFTGYVSAISAAFLHFGYVHLIGNLVYLLLFGAYLEDRLGSVLFALLFVGSTMFGNWAQGYYNIFVLKTNVGIIGASGAVSGILGAYLVRLYRSHVCIAWWVFAPLLAYTRAGRSEVPAVFAVAIWMLLQVVRSLLQFEGASANVAHMTHIAGFLFGVAFAVATGGVQKGRQEAHLLKASRYLRRGEYYGARDEYHSYLRYRPDDGEAHARLARACVQSGDRLGGHAGYLKAIELCLRDGRRGRAEDIYQEAVRGAGEFVLSSEPQLNLAFGLERNLKLELAVRAYENFLRRYPRHEEAAFALLRLANLCRGTIGDLDRARECYRRLIEHYPEDAWVDFALEQVRMLGTPQVATE